MCVPCKVIINQVTNALRIAIEDILSNESLHENKIPRERRMAMLDGMRSMDEFTYSGKYLKYPAMTLKEILLEFETYKVIPPGEIWGILSKE